MDGLGELIFSSLSEVFGGVVEFAGERGVELAGEAAIGAMVGERPGYDAISTFDRTLAGRRRELCINDI